MPSIIEIVMMIAIVLSAAFGYLNHSMIKTAMTPVTTATTTATSTAL